MVSYFFFINYQLLICQISDHCGDKSCLQCGEMAHLGQNCLENLKLKLKNNRDDEELTSTIQWKLNHT